MKLRMRKQTFIITRNLLLLKEIPFINEKSLTKTVTTRGRESWLKHFFNIKVVVILYIQWATLCVQTENLIVFKLIKKMRTTSVDHNGHVHNGKCKLAI